MVLTNEGSSVLHWAALKSTDSEMMRVLLDIVETRKLVDKQESYGDTALHACRYNFRQSGVESAKILLQAGASLTIKNNGEETPYKLA